jgi:hypothetical protein
VTSVHRAQLLCCVCGTWGVARAKSAWPHPVPYPNRS